MTEYVKFVNGGTSATMANREFQKFVRLARAEESPGEGWWPVQKVLPKPVPGEGEELAYSYTVRDGTAYKEYMLVPRGKSFMPRTWTPLSIKRACGERWAAFRAALEAKGIYEDFVMAQELREDDDAFKMGYQWAVQNYGQAAVDAVLAAAEGGV